MGYDLSNVIINLKKEIEKNAGGGGGPSITNETLKSLQLLQQTTIDETFSYEVTEPAYLSVSMAAMCGSDITLTLNGFLLAIGSGYYKFASGLFPVYPGDEIDFSCVSEGSDENLILNLMLINGLTVPEKKEPEHNNNQEDKK